MGVEYMGISKPKVSIITACYNSEKHIEDTIKSVRDQSYDNIEYIIVDGASSDSTMRIVNHYADNLNIIISEPDNGVYDAFNKGIAAATGEIIYFLNSDDYIFDLYTIEEVAGVFLENPELKILYGNVMILDGASGYTHIKGKKLSMDALKEGEMMPHQGVFVKKELFFKYGLFDTRYKIRSDFDFMIKCFPKEEQQALYIDKIIAVYREGGLSTNAKFRYLFEKESGDIINKHFHILRNNEAEELQKVQGLYRIWLESLLLKGCGISNCLKKYGIKNVAIFGTMKTALYLHSDLSKENFKVVAFLDNNRNMHNLFVRGTEVFPTSWIKDNQDKLDAIILSIESNKDKEVKEKISELVDDRVMIISWKELAEQVLDKDL